ncbi:MAG: type II secretion system protein J [Dissulfurispiraceae bacterium]
MLSTNPNREHGFTLLELMISITLIVFILLIAGTAIRLGLRSVDSGEKRIESLERFRASLNIIDAQVQSELTVPMQENAGKHIVFLGDGESMQFPSNFSLWGNQPGYVTVSYKVAQDQWGKQDLYVEESGIGVSGKGEVKLFEFFDRIYFDYFYKDPKEEKGSWVEEWTTTDAVPEKIRLHLVNGEREMSFIIPMKMRDLIVRAGAVAGANAGSH